MMLTGRDLIVLPGAIFFYLDGPRAPQDPRLSQEAQAMLDNMGDRLRDARSAIYSEQGVGQAGAHDDVVTRRLGVSLEWQFSSREVQLLQEALAATARDLEQSYSDARIMLPIDEHGLTVDDFRSLMQRLAHAGMGE